MPLENDRYTYRVTWSEEDGEYVGLCAEFPSLCWLARYPETALKGIRQLVAEVLRDMSKEGEALPEPISLRRYSGKFMVSTMGDVGAESSEEGGKSDDKGRIE